MSGLYGVGLYGVGLYGVGGSAGPDVTIADLTGGIILGQTDEYGVHWGLQRGSDPFGNPPAPRNLSGPRARAHGSWNATRFYDSREWPITLLVTADHDELHHARHRLAAVAGIGTTRVVVDEPHFGPRWADFRRRGTLEWTEVDPSHAQVSLVLVADDPLIRGDLLTASTGPASSSGGATWPLEWPATWDATVTSGLLELENDGLEPASAQWTVMGPIAEPYLIDVPTGRTLRSTLTLGPGEFVTFDTSIERAWAQDDELASRTSQVYGDWFEIPPGGTQVKFGGSSPGEGTLLTAAWHPTWI